MAFEATVTPVTGGETELMNSIDSVAGILAPEKASQDRSTY
jgi:hypothetical protein